MISKNLLFPKSPFEETLTNFPFSILPKSLKLFNDSDKGTKIFLKSISISEFNVENILLFVFWSSDSLKMLDVMWLQVAIIFSCLPVAATVFPVSQYYKAYVLKTSSAIIVTTVISILTIPIVLLLVIDKNIYNFLQLLFS